jgi:RNA polymerase sigma factor (sigma-70 family)
MSIEAGQQTDSQLLKRFLTERNEEAFAELVRRHGPIVLGICRRTLRNQHDADDAFQATFLVLARKADSIRNPDALPAWLYGVATRLANRHRQTAGRRRAREAPLADGAVPEDKDQQQRLELQRVLFEEIGRLPERYRVPFVLCYVNGNSNEEAAKLFNCPPGTVFSRLARARQQLRERLVQQGFTVSGGGLAVMLPTLPRAALVDVSAELLGGTARRAVAFAAKSTAIIPAPVLKLARKEVAAVVLLAIIPAPLLRLAEPLVALAGLLGIKWIIALSLSTAVVGTAGVLLVRHAVVGRKSVEERLKGTWLMQSMVVNGKPMPPNPAGRLTFTGSKKPGGQPDSVPPAGPGAPWSFNYTIDTSTSPMRINFTVQGETRPSIFDLQGDTLTVVMARTAGGGPSDAIPTSFTPGPENAVIVYKRER